MSQMELIKSCALRIVVIIGLNVVVLGFMFFGPQAERECFAAPPTSGTIDRSQDIIRQDEALRQEIEQEKKFFIEKIVLIGTSKLSSNEIKDITALLHGNWLTKKDFRQIMESIKVVYGRKGFNTSHLKITYDIKKSGTLEINVNELTR